MKLLIAAALTLSLAACQFPETKKMDYGIECNYGDGLVSTQIYAPYPNRIRVDNGTFYITENFYGLRATYTPRPGEICVILSQEAQG